MRMILLIGFGSFAGGILRYLLSNFFKTISASIFPYGTLAVNLLGCFAIGCIYGLAEKVNISYELRLTLITGLLGGFTTFSAFSIESVELIRTGHNFMAITYILLSVIVGLFMTVLGMWMFRIFATN